MIITIDGPSVSGKSTVARAVAGTLHYFYIASGYIYRGLAYALMHSRGYTLDTIAHATAHDISWCLDSARFEYVYDQTLKERIIFEGQDITEYLKTSTIDSGSSLIGTNQSARDFILKFIRALADHHDIVIDGRDCGSAMFPQAAYKFFLTASLHARAERWLAMHAQQNKQISIEQASALIADRDYRDAHRAVAPLKVPQDAIIIDSSNLMAEEVIALIIKKVGEQKKEEA